MTSEQIIEYERKIQKITKNKDIRIISPNDVYIPKHIVTDKEFWNQHGSTKKDYLEYIQNSETIYEQLNESLNGFENKQNFLKTNFDLFNLYVSLFDPGYILRLQEINGELYFTGDGRHRLLAARELNICLPAQIIHHDADAETIAILKSQMQKGN